MVHKLFSIFDSKAAAYLPPFVLHSEAMAERAFADCVNSDAHQFGKHPEDYYLFVVGSFNDSDGLLVARSAPELVCSGLNVRRSAPVLSAVEQLEKEAV